MGTTSQYSEYLFAVCPPNEDFGGISVCVTSREFWEEEGCMDDQSPPFDIPGYAELMESTFEPTNGYATVEEVTQDFLNLGFLEDEAFTDFCQSGG